MPSEEALGATVERVTPQQAATIAAAIACITVVGVGLSLSSPLIALMLARQGVSATLIGINTSVASIATLAIGSFVPGLARALGLRTVLMLALAVGGGSLALFPIFPSLPSWFVLRFVYGSAIGTLFVLSEYWINAVAPPRRRGFILGVYATALSLGFAAGPALLAAAGGAGDGLFFIGALFFLCAAIPIVIAGGSAPPIGAHTGKGAWAFILLAPVATMAGFVYGAVEQGSFAFLPLYGGKLGLDATQSALLLAVFGLGNVVSQIPLGLLADRMDRRALLLCCSAATVAGALTIPLITASAALLILVVFMTGGMVGALYTVGLSHLGARYSGSDLASANAAFVMLYSLGMLAGAPAIGIAFDAIDPHGFAYAMAAMCGLYCLLIAWRMRRRAG
jgi:MFS family permease